MTRETYDKAWLLLLLLLVGSQGQQLWRDQGDVRQGATAAAAAAPAPAVGMVNAGQLLWDERNLHQKVWLQACRQGRVLLAGLCARCARHAVLSRWR